MLSRCVVVTTRFGPFSQSISHKFLPKYGQISAFLWIEHNSDFEHVFEAVWKQLNVPKLKVQRIKYLFLRHPCFLLSIFRLILWRYLEDMKGSFLVQNKKHSFPSLILQTRYDLHCVRAWRLEYLYLFSLQFSLSLSPNKEVVDKWEALYRIEKLRRPMYIMQIPLLRCFPSMIHLILEIRPCFLYYSLSLFHLRWVYTEKLFFTLFRKFLITIHT